MSIERKTPSENEILFCWFNQYSGVTIKTPSKTLIADPVEIKAKTLKTLDFILITHEHYDHLDQPLVSEINRMTGCEVVADSTSTSRLENLIPPKKLHPIEPGSQIEFAGITVKAEASNHPQAATPVTYLITSEDGVKVYHTGDSAPFSEMSRIGSDEKPDVVFCTVGIAPGASAETGVEIARLTNPKVAVPYHTAQVEDMKMFRELLKKEMPKTTCLLPEVGKIYQVSKKS